MISRTPVADMFYTLENAAEWSWSLKGKHMCVHTWVHTHAGKKKKKAGNPEEEIKSLIGAWEDTERVSEGMFVPG